MKIDIAKQTEKIITVLNHLCCQQLYTWITFNGNLQYKFRYLEVTKGLINFAVQFYIYIIVWHVKFIAGLPFSKTLGVHNFDISIYINIVNSYIHRYYNTSDSKVHGANMGPTWVLSAPDGPHVGPMSLTIRDLNRSNFSVAVTITISPCKVRKLGHVTHTCCCSNLFPALDFVACGSMLSGKSDARWRQTFWCLG